MTEYSPMLHMGTCYDSVFRLQIEIVPGPLKRLFCDITGAQKYQTQVPGKFKSQSACIHFFCCANTFR